MRVESPNPANALIIQGRAVRINGKRHEANKRPVLGVAYKGAVIGEKAIIDTDEFTRATVGESVVPGDELTAFTDGKLFKAVAGDHVSYIALETADVDQDGVLILKKGYTK